MAFRGQREQRIRNDSWVQNFFLEGWKCLGTREWWVAQFCESTWRRQWHPTPVLLPGKSHGQRSLVGYSPWGCEESDMTERLHFRFSLSCIGGGNGNPLQYSCLENPLKSHWIVYFKTVVPSLFDIRDWFHGRPVFHGPGQVGDGFRMIQVHYVYCALYFYSNAAADLIWQEVQVCSLKVGDPALKDWILYHMSYISLFKSVGM